MLLSTLSVAQEPAIFHLDDKDGLPDVEFYDILEDDKGFIWLAADKGLYRYDGQEFKQFTSPEQRGRSVFYLTLDPSGDLWCTNLAGQFLYVDGDRLQVFADLRSQLNGELANFKFRKDELHVYAIDKLLRIDLKTQKLQETYTGPGNYSEPFLQDEKIFLSSSDGVGVMSDAFEIETLLEIKGVGGKGTKNFFFAYKGEQYHVTRALAGNAIVRVDYDAGTLESIQLPDIILEGAIPHITEHEGALWVFTDQGVHKGIIVNNTFTIDNTYLSKEYVTKFTKDREHSYWFTTLDNGVFIIPNINLKKYKVPRVEKITAIEKLNDSIVLFGSARGHLVQHNIRKNLTEQFIQLEDSITVNDIVYSKAKNLSYLSQWTVSSVLDHNTQELKKTVAYTGTKSLSRINDSVLLNAAYNRASLITIGQDAKIKEDITLNNKRAYTAFHDLKKKDNYVAYIDNLRRYDEFLEPKVVRNGIESILATSIAQTDDLALWAGTYNAGLMKIVDGDVIANYTTKDGLVSNDITLLRSDGDHLWIVTDDGIQYFNVIDNSLRTLKKRNGLLTYRIVDITMFDDSFLFTTEDGYYVVKRTEIFDPLEAPQVYFTNVSIDDKDVPLAEQYNVPFNKNRVQISFHTNGFKSGESIQYEYRLVGFDDDWKMLDSKSGSVEYASLVPKDYFFQVRSRTAPTAPLSQIQEIAISVKLPFWKQSWFLILLYMAGITLSVWLVWRRVRFRESIKNKQLKTLAVEKQITDLKLENLRSQMNPHFIFNALNSIQEYIVLNRKEEASDYLGKFADLIRTYLDHSSKGSITIAEEIESLDMYLELERLRFEDKLEYKIDSTAVDNPEGFRIPTMLVQPYVENAIKHGLLHKKSDRRLTISFAKSLDVENAILCIIEDNGIGRAKAIELKEKRDKIHKAFATKATRERLQLINKNVHKNVGVVFYDLKDTENNPAGTRVVLTIPYKEKR
ncbi:hypothetical protein EAX61_09875 [Dokdonia sinensis]|uniref:Signal transduction histidine kinase internal region domain-containing protein n=1 Tax=Dokdonia sinensis TaxID=2479847 RepID=A0A3M0GMT7_9FLAO|nr:hypothetical protein EAX61_09875 [Dokdonia sinensis]